MAKKKGLWANIHAKRKRGEKPARPGEEGYPKTLDIKKYKKGGPVKGSVADLKQIAKELVKASKMHKGQSKRVLKHAESMKMEDGGKMYGPSHNNGGIDINVEGGEYVIKEKSVNPKTEAVLEYINEYGKLPVQDARKRGKK